MYNSKSLGFEIFPHTSSVTSSIMMQPKSITIESNHKLSIPGTDVASFIFSSGTEASRRKTQYFDATNPSRCFSLSQAEVYVKQVAHGLQQLGLKPDDKVLLYSRNSLFFPILLWGVIASGCVFTACAPSASASGRQHPDLLVTNNTTDMNSQS